MLSWLPRAASPAALASVVVAASVPVALAGCSSSERPYAEPLSEEEGEGGRRDDGAADGGLFNEAGTGGAVGGGPGVGGGEPSAVPSDVACGAADECDDGVSCTVDDCIGGRCVFVASDDRCDDGNACTTDVCSESRGCVALPNEDSCDDGVFCNGADTCSEGECAVHAGMPCAVDAFCKEEADTCECETNDDCPEPIPGAWSDCGGFENQCDASGTRSREVTKYVCNVTQGECDASVVAETEACERVTEDTPCGALFADGTFGACSFASTCGLTGTKTKTVSDYLCRPADGNFTCQPVPRQVGEPCTRAASATNGLDCGPVSTSCGACSYSDVCDETQSRTCTDTIYACSAGECVGTAGESYSTVVGCVSRDTEGNTCPGVGEDLCFCQADPYNECDPYGENVCTETTFSCAAGKCRAVVEEIPQGGSCPVPIPSYCDPCLYPYSSGGDEKAAPICP